MCTWMVLFLAGATLEGAVIRGSVVEHQTGKALARASVTLQPVPGTPGSTLVVRTNSYGVFEFAAGGGLYLISAARRGFAPVQYGQKRWKAAGTPLAIEDTQSAFLNIRMPRYGSISGAVVDENDVGLPDHEVVAYRNERPPRMAAHAQTDDRGMFRLSGLEPGSYLVRSSARQYEDGGYLPTFHPETARVEEARAVEVALDQDAPDVKVRPFPGRLFSISGAINPCVNGQVATVTLVSDMGRETISTGGPFQFVAKPPGQYELWAVAPPDRRIPACASYLPFAIEQRDYTGATLSLRPMPEISFGFEGMTVDSANVKLLARRKDLAGEAPAETLRLQNGRTPLMPGRWDLMLAPSAAYVAVDFRGPRGERPEGGRADGWNEILVAGAGRVQYVLSSKPCAFHGAVNNGPREPVAGAPVFLEAYDPETRRRLTDLRVTLTDLRGQYQFYGLAPGSYRLVSTFEYHSPDSAAIDVMNPRTFKLEEGRDQAQDLDLYVLR